MGRLFWLPQVTNAITIVLISETQEDEEKEKEKEVMC